METAATGNTIPITPSEAAKDVVIVPDTSWLVAILDEKDSHHIAAESSLGALLPYKPTFHIPVVAAVETMSRLIRVNRTSVKDCKKKVFELFGTRLKAKGASRMYDFGEILKVYDSWSRKKVKALTTNDFLIVTEGMALGAKILTCDLEMYRVVKKYYPEIYFMSDRVVSQGSDLSRLIFDMQKDRK